jgi:formate hydrogenlyase subunit 6/NADH:ubiquinone oxidoreductase subunit I
MAKAKIKVDETKCSGCSTCQLWCSFTFDKSFNPLKSYVKQTFVPGEGFKINFTEDCTSCGICADHCIYGALVREKNK